MRRPWGLLWPHALTVGSQRSQLARAPADPLRWLACGLATVAVAQRAKGSKAEGSREVREVHAPETHRRNYEFLHLENGMQVGVG